MRRPPLRRAVRAARRRPERELSRSLLHQLASERVLRERAVRACWSVAEVAEERRRVEELLERYMGEVQRAA